MPVPSGAEGQDSKGGGCDADAEQVWPAALFWTVIVDPGFFIMERKMLKGIKARAERTSAPAPAH